jgi:hypothetical protein
MFGPARGYDDDRRADSLGAHGLDQLPAVEAGQHQVEYAGVRFLVTEPGESLVAICDPDRVEAGSSEMACHALRDHLVVLDDQNLWHRCHYRGEAISDGSMEGEWVVKVW